MSHLCLLGVATLTLTSAGFAGSDTNADLQARLTAAETRISELSATSNNNWLNDARADEIRGLVNDVLADADNRSNLQGGGAGYNGGFTVGSADGNWSMNINGLMQTAWSNVDDEAAGTNQWGFSDGRTWLNFSGTIAGDYGYDVRHDLEDSANDYSNANWDMGNGWNMTMGSFRRNDSRESMIGDGNQMGTDRASGDPTVVQGVRWANTSDDMRTTISLSNDQGDDGAANESAYNYNVRVEYLAEGSWGQFDEFTCADGSAAGTLVGFSYRAGDEGDGTDPDQADTVWNLDVQMQMGGSGLYVSYNDNEDDSAGTSTNSTQIMWSTWIDSDWELYVRYLDDDATPDGEVTSVGVNQYWAGHNAKWTTQYDMDDTDTAGDSNTVTSQIQLMF